MDNHKGKVKEMKQEILPPFDWLSLKRIIRQQLVGFVHTNLMFITATGLFFSRASLDSSMSLCTVLSPKISLISHHFVTRRWSLHADSLSPFFSFTENVSFDIFFLFGIAVPTAFARSAHKLSKLAKHHSMYAV
jgi:hypothetical protein